MRREDTKKVPAGFLWIGNRLCLDFINTTPVFDRGPTELLESPDALLRWLSEAEVFGPAELKAARALGPEGLRVGLLQALRLRLALRNGMNKLAEGRPFPASQARILNQFTAKPTLAASVHMASWGWNLQARWLIEEPADLIRPLAHDALGLLVHPDAGVVRKCANPECPGIFLDTSKSHRRRWCSMALCGNRAKVTGFRSRRRT